MAEAGEGDELAADAPGVGVFGVDPVVDVGRSVGDYYQQKTKTSQVINTNTRIIGKENNTALSAVVLASGDVPNDFD